MWVLYAHSSGDEGYYTVYIIWITYLSLFHIGLCTGVNQTVRETIFAITKSLEYLLHICKIAGFQSFDEVLYVQAHLNQYNI